MRKLSKRKFGFLMIFCLRMPHSTICNSFFNQKCHLSFLHHIVKSGDKWVLHVIRKWKTQWLSKNNKSISIPKPSLHTPKSLFCFWWNIKCVIHSELLQHRWTITTNIYCQQLGRIVESVLLWLIEEVLFFSLTMQKHTLQNLSQQWANSEPH